MKFEAATKEAREKDAQIPYHFNQSPFNSAKVIKRKRHRRNKSNVNIETGTSVVGEIMSNNAILEQQKSVEQKINDYISHKMANIGNYGFYAYQRS